MRSPFFVLFFTATLSLNTYGSSEAPKKCRQGLLSLEAVQTHFGTLLEAWQGASEGVNQQGIGNPDLVDALTKVSLLTGAPAATLGKQALAVSAIKSAPGIPDGDEIDGSALTKILFLSHLSNQTPEKVFQQTVEFLPLIQGKVHDTETAMALVNLSVHYGLTPQQTIEKWDEFEGSSAKLKEKISKVAEKGMAAMGELTQALVRLSSGGGGEVPAELVVAVLESAMAKKTPIQAGINALEQIFDHPKASQYTAHEMAAMVKALVVLGKPIDDSVAKLEALEKGSIDRFGQVVSPETERPVVNMVLLGGQKPKTVLDAVGHVIDNGSGYSETAGTLFFNKALLGLAKKGPKSKLLKNSAVIPE